MVNHAARKQTDRKQMTGITLAAAALLVGAMLLCGVASVRAADLLPAGEPAPAFALPNQDGREISSDFLAGGWYLLYFYPKDETPGCTKEACTFRDRLGELSALGVRVLGVSFDSQESHRRFADKHALQFDLLSDPKGEVVARYHAKSFMPGIARRVSYLVDDEGIIRKVYPNVSPAQHAGEIIDDVKALKGR